MKAKEEKKKKPLNLPIFFDERIFSLFRYSHQG
jgi:hypothetical protein